MDREHSVSFYTLPSGGTVSNGYQAIFNFTKGATQDSVQHYFFKEAWISTLPLRFFYLLPKALDLHIIPLLFSFIDFVINTRHSLKSFAQLQQTLNNTLVAIMFLFNELTFACDKVIFTCKVFGDVF